MADIFPPTDDIAPTGNSYGYYDEHYAAEIERLRAALQEIAGHKISGVIPDDYNVRSWMLHNYVEIREIARAALEGKKKDD